MIMFSVIMPTYNRGYIIEKSIVSVISQTYPNWELIIVDDGSTDNTCDKVYGMKDSRIHYIRCETNEGANHARNIGIENASGAYLAFLDSDNQWHKDYLESQLDIFQSNISSVDVVFARCDISGSWGHIIFPNNLYTDFSSNERILKYALYDSIFDMNVMCMKRTVWAQSGKFDENLSKLQDWEFVLRMLVFGNYQFRFNTAVLCDNYIQSDSIANKKELFWDSRLYIFAKYIDKCREMGEVVNVVLHLLKQPDICHLSSDHVKKLMDILSLDEVAELCKKYYEEYTGLCQKIEDNCRKAEEAWKLVGKNEQILQIERMWIALRQDERDIASFLAAKGLYKVAIYGYGVLGRLLLRELTNSRVRVKYIIDEKKLKIEKGADMPTILSKSESLKCVNNMDAIIVTAVSAYEGIKQELEKKTNVKIINLGELFV